MDSDSSDYSDVKVTHNVEAAMELRKSCPHSDDLFNFAARCYDRENLLVKGKEVLVLKRDDDLSDVRMNNKVDELNDDH